jgi:hypothetical protein
MPEEKTKKSADPQKEEKDKHNALLAGVIFFMALIIVLWMMHLKTVLKSPAAKPGDRLNINKLSQDFQKAFSDVGAKINELKKIDATELEKYPLQFPASSTALTADSTSTSTIKN